MHLYLTSQFGVTATVLLADTTLITSDMMDLIELQT
jgi:hypothetical protein